LMNPTSEDRTPMANNTDNTDNSYSLAYADQM
jgi:hypothetical protein